MTRAVYIAGPMTGLPEFNFPAFFAAEEELLGNGMGDVVVFNPARRDNDVHGEDISVGNAGGSIEQAAAQHGFSIREALGADTAWICATATEVRMLKGWSNSSGATAERALALALKLIVSYEDPWERWTSNERKVRDQGYAEGIMDATRQESRW
jgi:hypothetical protein